MPSSDQKFAVVAAALTSDPRQAAMLARQMDFPGLLFNAYSSALSISDLSITGRREFQRMLSSQDRELAGFRVDLGAKGFGPGADVDQLLSQLKKVVEAAAGMAAPLLCVELGPLPEPPREKKVKPKITAEEAGLLLLPTFAPPAEEAKEPVVEKIDPVFAAQVDGALSELGILADRFNVTVAFRCELASFAALERALAAARCPWFGVDLDALAIVRDAWPMDEIFSRLGALIRHVRARDALLGSDGRTKPMAIGQGAVKWEEVLSDLEGAGYHGWITIDPMELQDRTKGAAIGLKYLRESVAR